MTAPESSEFTEPLQLRRCLGLVDQAAGVCISTDEKNCAECGDCKFCEVVHKHWGCFDLFHIVFLLKFSYAIFLYSFILFQILSDINGSCLKRMISCINGHDERESGLQSIPFRTSMEMDRKYFLGLNLARNCSELVC